MSDERDYGDEQGEPRLNRRAEVARHALASAVSRQGEMPGVEHVRFGWPSWTDRERNKS